MLNTIQKPEDGPVIMTITGNAGLGKEQPISSIVFTPIGVKKLGDIRIGDLIFGKDGNLTKVTGIYPQGIKPVYKVSFSDGYSALCGIDHLWKVHNVSKQKDHVFSTRELISNKFYLTKGGQRKYKIPLCDAVNFSGKDVIIPPYVMGVILGDGSCNGSSLQISNPIFDSFIIDKVKNLIDDHLYINGRDTGGCMQYCISDPLSKGNKYLHEIRELGVNVRSKEKFIPDLYKFNSVDVRKNILHGLMDTDGSCFKNRTTFHTLSEKLADDVVFLVQSLGGIAIKRVYFREDKGGKEFQVNVKSFENPFTLKRKADQWKLNEKCRMSRKITNIEKLDYDEEQVCISVDNEDNLYLTDNFIVTHNTSLAATFPKPVFIRAEDGLKSIPLERRPDAFPLINDVETLWGQLQALIREDHDYQTVVVDSITQLDTLFQQHIINSDPKKPTSINQAMGGYGAGFSALAGLHGRVRKAAELLKDRGINVIFIAHADTESLDLPDQDPFSIYTIRVHHKSLSHYCDNVDMVAFVKLETVTIGEGEKKKAISDGSRIITCYATASSISKNRFGITEDLPFINGENPFINIIKSLKGK